MQLSGSNSGQVVWFLETMNSSFTFWQSYLTQLSFGGDHDSEGCQMCKNPVSEELYIKNDNKIE